MKTPNHAPEDLPPHLKAILGAQLKSTSREFEDRFNDLRRRLANEEATPLWQRGWRALQASPFSAVQFAAIAAALTIAVTFYALRESRARADGGIDLSSFHELVALEESLVPALALTDPEALEVLLYMPTN